MNDITTRLTAVLECQLGVNPSIIIPEADFYQDLGADSLDAVEIIMAVEEEFGLDIPDEDAEQIKTVQNAINYLQSRLPQ
jgi:acyl carrier protein